jgi:2-hydroxy-palmitic acid dioxygenase Mpo1-like
MSSPSKTSTPRRPVLRFLRKRLDSWLVRHQHPFNFAIHLIGIPVAVAGIPLLFLAPWYWGVGALVFGYFLQWLGHRVEGNDVGEWAGIKRLLGLPYVAIAPRYLPEKETRGQGDKEPNSYTGSASSS